MLVKKLEFFHPDLVQPKLFLNDKNISRLMRKKDFATVSWSSVFLQPWPNPFWLHSIVRKIINKIKREAEIIKSWEMCKILYLTVRTVVINNRMCVHRNFTTSIAKIVRLKFAIFWYMFMRPSLTGQQQAGCTGDIC